MTENICQNLGEQIKTLKEKLGEFNVALDEYTETHQGREQLKLKRDEINEQIDAIFDLIPNRKYEKYECLKTLSGHEGSVVSVVESKDGKTIISGSRDNTIKIWDKETGKCLKTLTGHTDQINSVVLTPDGKEIISGSDDGTIRVWDIETGLAQIRSVIGVRDVFSVDISNDGKTIIAGTRKTNGDNEVIILDKDAKIANHGFIGHSQQITCVKFSHDGKKIFSTSEDCTFSVWDVASGNSIERRYLNHGINYILESKDGKSLITADGGNNVRIWPKDMDKFKKVFVGHLGPVYSVCESANPKFIISGSNDGTVKVWDKDSGECLKTLKGHNNDVYSVLELSDKKTIVSGGADYNIRLWGKKK